MEKGKFEAAAAVVGFEEDRPVKKVPIPETRRLEKNMLFNDKMVPSISLLRQHFVKEGKKWKEQSFFQYIFFNCLLSHIHPFNIF